ncbi:MAG TPA: malto-oligosyltrehalose synthase [Rhodothermales bacterium]|nr:malto-oligosyltrehalose synthase [Rhodothermales bacterium]
MTATYRLQLLPEFTFADVEAILPYLKRLGISHVYLSPITQARPGSTHGYDVADHNTIRAEFGGRPAFDRLLAAARAQGLAFILDFVPNHAGAGPGNAYWQDVLAYGPYSAFAEYFDVDWAPLKPELHGKILLPFLGTTYGEVFDNGEIAITYDDGRFFATYYQNLYALSPASYATILNLVLPNLERSDLYWDFKDLVEAYQDVEPQEREKAESLRPRLMTYAARTNLNEFLPDLPRDDVHDVLENQFWRLSYWKTAGYEINYRRFFDINGLIGLRMEDEHVFWDTHRLLGELLAQEGVHGVRIDHIDGLFDPHKYLNSLRALGAQHIWVEKILARGEVLPDEWPVEGTTGYEFMNDVMGVLLRQDGYTPLEKIYHRFVLAPISYERIVYNSKQLITSTALSSELFRLAYELDRISEADYHTRDFTLEALREALAETVAAFGRYRTYLPFEEDEALAVIREAVHRARQRNPAMESSVYKFLEDVILGNVRKDLKAEQRAWTGRFQQYTAPVAAKGVEDTAFYRYLLLLALNEVGGEPDAFGITEHAFHSHNRFRANRYPCNLLATATHDHKRGEDLRMRLIALAEVPEQWDETATVLSQIAVPYRMESAPSDHDEYLFFQTLAALWHGADRKTLSSRLQEYMVKAARESKLRTSWINQDAEYEETLQRFVDQMVGDPKTEAAVAPLSARLAELGFFNSLGQVLLKFASPGVPDIYQGCELLDFSLVDPDNRRPVDYGLRSRLLEGLNTILENPEPEHIRNLVSSRDPQTKLYLTARLLRLRNEHLELFDNGSYRPLDVEGEGAGHWIAYAREYGSDALLVLAPRFPSTFPEHGCASILLPDELAGRGKWTEALTGAEVEPADRIETSTLPLPWAVLLHHSA